MRLWIDDRRLPPNGWFWAKTSKEAMDYLYWHLFDLEEISFDHDLGLDDTTRAVALKLEEWASYGWLHPIKLKVHSDNAPGIRWLRASIDNITQWSENTWESMSHSTLPSCF
jgi:hypothetical protein